ncbi:MAG: hypothetical protein ACI8PZ_004171 [Myxococcota bacterium]|jgi:hypothetical protein
MLTCPPNTAVTGTNPGGVGLACCVLRRLSVLLLSLAMSAQAGPLTLKIDDPYVIAVVLECGRDLMKATVKHGQATFDEVPSQCTVDLIRRTGVIDEPGVWSCGLDGCTLDDVHHAAISDVAGRINVVITGDAGGNSSLEITCPSGFRQRQDLVESTATFNDLPNEECLLAFKGGIPAKFRSITSGTWYCNLVGTAAVCNRK